MARIRIFQKFGVRVWFLDEDEGGQRELMDRIGHLTGKIDWRKTAETCRPIGDEGLEIRFVFEDEGAESPEP